jgi:hypothetical protein
MAALGWQEQYRLLAAVLGFLQYQQQWQQQQGVVAAAGALVGT